MDRPTPLRPRPNQTCRMFDMAGPLQPPLRIINILLVYLLLADFCRGQFQLTGPTQPIVATLGDDIILPCHLVPGADVVDKTLEWTRPELDPRFVFVRHAGQDLVNLKNPSYKGRTSLYTGELKHGNISLKLSNVKPSDGGKYKCYVPDVNTESFVELVVASRVVSWPTISLSGLDRNKGAVVLQCNSTGWYPEPEVFWLDGEGNLPSAGPTETVRGPDDLYTVSSRVTVEKRHSNRFTCRVQQNHINQITETHIHVPETKRSHRGESDEGEKNQESEVLMTEKHNSSSLSQNSTTEPAVVFKVDRRGKYIQLRNTSTEDQQLGGWVLKIQVNYNQPVIHTFEDSFNLMAGKDFTVGYHGYGDFLLLSWCWRT